jgi:hypothetical protein
MKKIIIILLTCSIACAQTIEIEYNFILLDEKDDYGDVRAENITLITNQNESLLKRVVKDTMFDVVFSGYMNLVLERINITNSLNIKH